MFAQLTVPSIVPCTLGILLTQLDKDSVTNLESALADRSVSSSAIARAIRVEAEVAIADETVTAHRKGVCRCSRA